MYTLRQKAEFFKHTINMMPSSNLHNFLYIYEMYICGHFLGKICWLLALTRYAPKSKVDERNFF